MELYEIASDFEGHFGVLNEATLVQTSDAMNRHSRRTAIQHYAVTEDRFLLLSDAEMESSRLLCQILNEWRLFLREIPLDVPENSISKRKCCLQEMIDIDSLQKKFKFEDGFFVLSFHLNSSSLPSATTSNLNPVSVQDPHLNFDSENVQVQASKSASTLTSVPYLAPSLASAKLSEQARTDKAHTTSEPIKFTMSSFRVNNQQRNDMSKLMKKFQFDQFKTIAQEKLVGACCFSNKNIFAVMPTGSGTSVIFCNFDVSFKFADYCPCSTNCPSR